MTYLRLGTAGGLVHSDHEYYYRYLQNNVLQSNVLQKAALHQRQRMKKSSRSVFSAGNGRWLHSTRSTLVCWVAHVELRHSKFGDDNHFGTESDCRVCFDETD